ncbi:hypothetical protein GCM10022198_15320 [Klugiella xanthotipulae]
MRDIAQGKRVVGSRSSLGLRVKMLSIHGVLARFDVVGPDDPIARPFEAEADEADTGKKLGDGWLGGYCGYPVNQAQCGHGILGVGAVSSRVVTLFEDTWRDRHSVVIRTCEGRWVAQKTAQTRQRKAHKKNGRVGRPGGDRRANAAITI